MSENDEPQNPAAAAGESFPSGGIEAGPPHKALFLVLSKLHLRELLSMSAVCKSLRHAVEHDVLAWLHIVIDPPLSYRLRNEILLRITKKANGRLTTLALIDCFDISDSALQEVVEKNPLLTKLCLLGCTSLSPGGVVRAVRTLSQHSRNLKCLMIDGINQIDKYEHLEVLKCHLQNNQSQLQQQQQQQKEERALYHEHIDRSKLLSDEYHQPMIDVQMCPMCKEVRRVYDCSRERCKIKEKEKLQAHCRGCKYCIMRCEECGGCVDDDDDDDEIEGFVCSDSLCSSCCHQLPQCKNCNRPNCKGNCEHV